MASSRETEAVQSWPVSDETPDWDDDVFEDGFFDDEEDYDSVEAYFHDANKSSLTTRQRIEIARENKILLSSLNDLDLYDELDYLQNQHSAEYSY